jgi:hypothetical protein
MDREIQGTIWHDFCSPVFARTSWSLTHDQFEPIRPELGFTIFVVVSFLLRIYFLRHNIKKLRSDSDSTQDLEWNSVPTRRFRGGFGAPVKPPPPATRRSSTEKKVHVVLCFRQVWTPAVWSFLSSRPLIHLLKRNPQISFKWDLTVVKRGITVRVPHWIIIVWLSFFVDSAYGLGPLGPESLSAPHYFYYPV